MPFLFQNVSWNRNIKSDFLGAIPQEIIMALETKNVTFHGLLSSFTVCKRDLYRSCSWWDLVRRAHRQTYHLLSGYFFCFEWFLICSLFIVFQFILFCWFRFILLRKYNEKIFSSFFELILKHREKYESKEKLLWKIKTLSVFKFKNLCLYMKTIICCVSYQIEKLSLLITSTR